MIRPWEDVARFYERLLGDLPQLRAMFDLVVQIQHSKLHRLHAWTSMHDLCIVQQAVTYPYDGPYLRISPKFDGSIELRYVDTKDEKKQWQRMVPEDAAFARLERFTDELRWFPRLG